MVTQVTINHNPPVENKELEMILADAFDVRTVLYEGKTHLTISVDIFGSTIGIMSTLTEAEQILAGLQSAINNMKAEQCSNTSTVN